MEEGSDTLACAWVNPRHNFYNINCHRFLRPLKRPKAKKLLRLAPSGRGYRPKPLYNTSKNAGYGRRGRVAIAGETRYGLLALGSSCHTGRN